MGSIEQDHDYFVEVLRDLFPARRGRRDRSADNPRPISDAPGKLVAESSAERRASAVGALVLAQVAERGGTNLDKAALLSMADKSLATFEEGDRAAVFDEMVAILDWLSDNLRRKDRERERDPSLHSLGAGGGRRRERNDRDGGENRGGRGRGRSRSDREGGGDRDAPADREGGGDGGGRGGRGGRGARHDVEFDPGPAIDALEKAIEQGDDVLLDYYSFHRKTWSERRVTPQSIVGEFLVAHCHMRGDDRRFRLTRIRKVLETPTPES